MGPSSLWARASCLARIIPRGELICTTMKPLLCVFPSAAFFARGRLKKIQRVRLAVAQSMSLENTLGDLVETPTCFLSNVSFGKATVCKVDRATKKANSWCPIPDSAFFDLLYGYN